MTDQNRKTLRSFYCRDYLWDLFEQMTGDLGCSMDYLINESMRHYARSRDYVPSDQEGYGSGQQQQPTGYGTGGSGYQSSPPSPPNRGGGAGGGGGYGQQQNMNVNSFGSPMEHRTFNQIPPVNQQQNRPQQSGGGVQFGGGRSSGGPPPPPPRPNPPQQQSGGGWGQQSAGGGGYGQQNYGQPPSAGQASQPPIYLLFNNNRYVIDKEKFVIGRGSQQTDLTIRDGNISRKHCAVIFRNGSYYIKDLGSTNGVEYRGNRIESKKIEESDTFYLCDYELRFTYRP